MKITDLINEMPSDSNIINKMKAACERQPYMNCKLAVQMTIDEPNITSLPKVSFEEAKPGDVLAFDIHHYAIMLSGGMVVDVAEWGAKPEVHSMKDLIDEYDKPTAVYRPTW